MIKIHVIMVMVSRTLGIPIREIKSDSRKQELVEARAIFVYLCHKRNISPNQIMRYLRRHRTTFYNTIKTFNQCIIYKDFREKVSKFSDDKKDSN